MNVELRVGAVSETITVSGESPVVDVVNAKQQSTVTNEIISAIPTARLYHSLVTLVPGVTVSGSQDVGGFAGPVTVTFAMRGGPGNEGRLTVDGLSLGASLNGTGVWYTVADVGNAQEVVFTTAGGLGESEVGGPSMNLVPRQGGNTVSGPFFANWANDSFQTSNYTEEIQAAGLRAPNLMTKIWDINARRRRSHPQRPAVVFRRPPAIKAIGSWWRGCSSIRTPATQRVDLCGRPEHAGDR